MEAKSRCKPFIKLSVFICCDLSMRQRKRTKNFYNKLQAENISSHDVTIVEGYFNARVCRNKHKTSDIGLLHDPAIQRNCHDIQFMALSDITDMTIADFNQIRKEVVKENTAYRKNL